MKKNIFTIMLLLGTYSSFAQNVKDIASVPSPNAASLGVFGETPIPLASGTADVSVPLYNLKDSKLSVPRSAKAICLRRCEKRVLPAT